MGKEKGEIVIQKSRMATAIDYNQTKIIEVNPDTMHDNRLISFFDGVPASEQYKILRTQILHKTKEEGLNTILVTSVGENEGKSITAANLAISLAREVVHTVLLVDTDLRNPFLHKLFGVKPVGGLSDCLLNDIPLSNLLINPGINKLTILPGHHRLRDSADIVGSPKMVELIREMKNRYRDRYIIFDSPPLIGSADTLILSEYVDGVILVIEHGKTQKSQIEKAMELLKGANLIGTILNKAVVSRKDTYPYGYHS